MSQVKLVEKMEISTGYLGNMESENSKACYSAEQIGKLSAIFNCSPREFAPEKAIKD
jgi:hypothetical protein